MPGEQQRPNVLALVLLAILTGGTASFAGIKFSWVPSDAAQSEQAINQLSDAVQTLRDDIRGEIAARQEADAALSQGAEQIYREFIIVREQCRYLDRRCSRLERGDQNDAAEY